MIVPANHTQITHSSSSSGTRFMVIMKSDICHIRELIDHSAFGVQTQKRQPECRSAFIPIGISIS